MKEEILVCFGFEFNFLATLALVVGSNSLSSGFPLNEFLVMTSALGTIFLSTLLVAATLNPISEGGAHCAPPLRNIALNQVIWGPGPPKLIDFS